VAVVGGGLAGLAAAYFAKRQRPEAEIVVLEAGLVGSGASGRSTGMVGPNVGGTIVALRRRYGDAMATRMFRASLDAVATLTRLVREEALSCDLVETGQLVIARTRREAEALRAQAASFSELGFDVPLIERGTLEGVVPDATCVAALSYDRAALVDPLRLCRGLRDRLTAMGVPVHERAQVTRIAPGAGVELEMEGGSLRAGKVLLATDGFSHHLGVLRRCVIPMQAHVVLTAVLPPVRLAQLGWPGRQAIVESRNFFNYYRLTADDRLLFGGGRPTVHETGVTQSRAHARTWAQVENELRCRFPSLADVPIADRWYGTIGCTLDRLPIVGPLPGLPNVWFSGAWSGHGLAMSVACAELVAGLMNGATEAVGGDLPWVRGRAPGLPAWRRLRTTGVRAYLQSLEMADRMASAVDRIQTRETRRRILAPGRA
jgi:gamma-glutamylputrescine oxidase